MDGRDIGSVVFPNADLKIYLDATAEERARRRCLDFQAQGQDIQLTEVLADVVERDRLDREREIAPLLIADDAIVIDSTHLTREEVIQQIQGLIKEKQL
jgi:cytidylate kinase